MIDPGWLNLQYRFAAQNPKMTVLCSEIMNDSSLPDSTKIFKVDVPSAFGCHHSKVTVLFYKDNGIRIMVSTADYYSGDWETRTQG